MTERPVPVQVQVPAIPTLSRALLDRHAAAHAAVDRVRAGAAARRALELCSTAQAVDAVAGLTPPFTGEIERGVPVDPGLFPPPRAFISRAQQQRVAGAASGLAHLRQRAERAGTGPTPLIDLATVAALHALAATRHAEMPGLFREGPSAWSSRHNPYAPTAPAEIEGVVEAMATTASAALAQGVAPVVVASWAAFVIVACHPFTDGNGRVSRLTYLLLTGYPGSSRPPAVDLGAVEEMARHRRRHVAAVMAGEAHTPTWDATRLDAAPAVAAMLDASITGAATTTRRLERLAAADGALEEAVSPAQHRTMVLWTWIRRFTARDDEGVDAVALEALATTGFLQRVRLPASRRRPGGDPIGYCLSPAALDRLGPPP